MSESVRLFETYRPLSLVGLLGCVAALKEEVTVRFSDKGVSILEMDNEHVSMVDLGLPPKYFDEYSFYEGSVSLNLKQTLEALGKVTKADLLTVNLAPGEGAGSNPKLELVMVGTKGLRRVKRVETLSPMDEEVPQPKIFFKSVSRLIADSFKFAIEDQKDTSEHIRFTSTTSGLKLSTVGNYGSNETTFLKGDDNTIDHRVEADSKSTFPINYLIQLMKPLVKVCEVVTVSLSEDMPVKVEAELPVGRLIYHLSPCIGCS